MIRPALSVMQVTFDDYITLISLGISSASLAVVIFLARSIRKPSSEQHHIETPVSSDDTAVEVSAIVSEFGQRMRRLEESLVDQKVKMEILELRASRASRESAPIVAPVAYTRLEGNGSSNNIDNQERPSVERVGLLSGIKTASQKERPEIDKKIGGTEIEALRLVFEGRGKMSAREIQQRIGRTREHTARMMNSLYHDGLVERDVTARPFSYSITEKGREVLNG